jgi:lipopolysaccharide/colanic/teichoic acid biosynthesis glycosyltransferase
MRRLVLLNIDGILMLTATFIAKALRENLELDEERIIEFLPYFCATVIGSLIAFPAFGLNRAVWRFSSLHDYLRVTAAVAAVILGATVMTFAYNRLEGVARSLPFLQMLAGTALLTTARVLHKLFHLARHERKSSAALLDMAHEAPAATVLIAGVSRLAEMYIQAAELFPGRIKIAGLLGSNGRQVGRLVAAYPILGVPEDIEMVLDRLDVHGMSVDRIVVASDFAALSPRAREALIHAERSRSVTLQFLVRDLGFDPESRDTASSRSGQYSPAAPELRFEIAPAELEMLARRRYWKIKRAVDALLAFFLLVVCTPVMLLGAVLVAASLGFPVVFWQQRPGLGGRPFRLYKLRTMNSIHTCDGRRLSDGERTSLAGSMLRRLRLDELPQLFNILRGDMSFVGPRPLLSREQPEAYRARLLVRPGLTGWAQVVGGREISSEDKAALDVWYVRNAGLALDLEIVIRTIPVVLFGERVSVGLIERAWNDLSESGVLKGGRTQKTIYAAAARV